MLFIVVKFFFSKIIVFKRIKKTDELDTICKTKKIENVILIYKSKYIKIK